LTGQPKGVVVTHGNLLQNEFMIQSAVETSEETVIVTGADLSRHGFDRKYVA